MDSSKEFQLMLDKATESEPEAFKDFDRTKNVQDQLQEMVNWNPNHPQPPVSLVKKISDFMFQDYEDYTVLFTSMEQLWLALVIKEQKNKTWDGEKWVAPE